MQCSSKDLHAEHIPHLQGNMYHVREAWVFRSFSASSPTTVVKIHRDYPEAAISICVARGTYYGRAPAPLRHPCPLPCVIDSRHLEAECSGGFYHLCGLSKPKIHRQRTFVLGVGDQVVHGVLDPHHSTYCTTGSKVPHSHLVANKVSLLYRCH